MHIFLSFSKLISAGVGIIYLHFEHSSRLTEYLAGICKGTKVGCLWESGWNLVTKLRMRVK